MMKDEHYLDKIINIQNMNIHEKFSVLKKTILELLSDIENEIKLKETLNYNKNLQFKLSQYIDEWPESVSDNMIVDDKGEMEKKFRAIQIVGFLHSMTSFPLNKSRILDFGCGEGHTAIELSSESSSVVGFDIQRHEWINSSNCTFTNNLEDIYNSKFDVILLYDVFDHIKVDIVDTLKMLRNILHDDGCIILRNHPWTSRHGGHLYNTYNKAYLHLAMSEDDLLKNNMAVPYNIKAIRPMAVYNRYFKEAGFTIDMHKIKAEEPEQFFHQDEIISAIIKNTWDGHMEKEQALKIMSNQFIDYRLIK